MIKYYSSHFFLYSFFNLYFQGLNFNLRCQMCVHYQTDPITLNRRLRHRKQKSTQVRFQPACHRHRILRHSILIMLKVHFMWVNLILTFHNKIIYQIVQKNEFIHLLNFSKMWFLVKLFKNQFFYLFNFSKYMIFYEFVQNHKFLSLLNFYKMWLFLK